MKLYGLKNCDTCRKAMKELDAAGVNYEYIDVRADGVPADTLKKWIKAVGADQLVNRRSTTWRGLLETEKEALNNTEALVALLQTHSTLIKRPVVIHGKDIYLGWAASTKESLGL